MSEERLFPFADYEPRWQKRWEDEKVFRAADPADKPKGKKLYILDMFPYPSAAGLHVGHPEGYTATDILCRYRRMQGFNVLHPMGWDAFGLPAEQYAIQTGVHPREATRRNVENFKKQIKRLGFSYDWDREVDTTDPAYYRWTQWIFLKLFEKGLAYESQAPVWWCEELGCVLANEEVVDGKSERGGHPVVRRPMRQWMLKITAYADRLLEDLKDVDWPEAIKEMQRNWIGRSEGAEVEFTVGNKKIRVFTTRPDTLFGATYMVLAPEHELVKEITAPSDRAAVEAYAKKAAAKSELERTDLAKEKTGVFTGASAVNPVNGKAIPVWIADYVMASYGTGAIMAVPAHDARDYAFAKQYRLPIVEVIKGGDIAKEAFTGEGVNISSGFLDGLATPQAKEKMIAWLEKEKKGARKVHYKLRDWLFSRQRYWGEPIPVVHCAKCGVVPLSEKDLPLLLPEMSDFKPPKTGEPPLSKAEEWLKAVCPKCKGPAKRETNTMPQWAGSCWYYLRYIDPRNPKEAVAKDKEKYWMNVDLYVGGAEHAVLHLLYSRFWHKVLFDLGFVSTKEPFKRLVNQGIILGEDGQKMSKSRGNVVNPDEVIDRYGADAMRLYEMFMGPLEQSKPWSTKGVEGVYRFLGRVWTLFDKCTAAGGTPHELVQLEHRTIKKVTEDLEKLQFNTAISALMILSNELAKSPSKTVFDTLILLLSPFAPHMAEELWHKLGHKDLIALQKWPEHDPKLVEFGEIEIPVQVNGKLRSRLKVPADVSEADLKALVLADDKIKEALGGKAPSRVVVVPKRLVNIVVA